MKVLKILLVMVATCLIGPALADRTLDTTTVGSDNSLNNGAGSSGPGMSGYLHQGMQDRSVLMTSVRRGKKCVYRVNEGFSKTPVYNNNADIALQHIR